MAKTQANLKVEGVESVGLADAGIVLVTVRAHQGDRAPVSPRLVVAANGRQALEADRRQVPVLRIPPVKVRDEPTEDGSRTWSAVFSLPRHLALTSPSLALEVEDKLVDLPAPVTVGRRETPGGAGSPRRRTPRCEPPPAPETTQEWRSLACELEEADRRLAAVQSRISQARAADDASAPSRQVRPEAHPGAALDEAQRWLSSAHASLDEVEQDGNRRPDALAEAVRGVAEAQQAIEQTWAEVARDLAVAEHSFHVRLHNAREGWARVLDRAEAKARKAELDSHARGSELEKARRRLTELERETADRMTEIDRLVAEAERRLGARRELEARLAEVVAQLPTQLESVLEEIGPGAAAIVALREQIAHRESAVAALLWKLEHERVARARAEDELHRRRQEAERLDPKQPVREGDQPSPVHSQESQEAMSLVVEQLSRTTDELRDHLSAAIAGLEATSVWERRTREEAQEQLRTQAERAAAERSSARRAAERARRLERELNHWKGSRALTHESEPSQRSGEAGGRSAEDVAPAPHRSPTDKPVGNDHPVQAASPEAGYEPGGGEGDWLIQSLPRLARDDAVAAGHLLVALLPAQGLIGSENVDYDLQLAGIGRFAVAVRPGRAEIRPLRASRPPATIAFEVEADAVGLARVVAGHRESRLRRSGRLRVRGRQRRAASLPELGRHAIGIPELARLGLQVNPLLVYQALRWAVDPAWTQGHRFCLAHVVTGARAETCYVSAADGGRLSVGLYPNGETVTATIRTPAEDFLALLAGLPARTEVSGEESHVLQLQAWIVRAQGGAPGGDSS